MSIDIPAPDPRDQELAALRQRVAELEAAAATHALDLAIGKALRTLIPDNGVFVYDADLRYVVIDAPVLTNLGIDTAPMIGQTITELFPPELVSLLDGPYRAALKGDIGSFMNSFAGGAYRFTTVPVRDESGNIIAGLSLLRDVSAQREAEQRVRIFEQLVEQAPDGIIVRTPDHTIRYANPAIEAMIGRSPLEGSISESIMVAEALPDFDAVEARLNAQETWSGRLLYRRSDGTSFPGRAVVFPIQDDENAAPLIGVMIRDVTDEEQMAQQQQEQLLAAQQAIIRELATPLIPLADEVIAMPLVGSIDTGRAQQITETLLEGIVAYQAEYAILDITGVKLIDTQVAQVLLRIAQAAKLLGTQILLSGIGSEMALTLTHLEADLTGITPVANLRQAITYAMTQRAAETRA